MTGSPQTRPLSLSSNGLHHLNHGRYENDFTFFVDGAAYCCPLFVAEFISPRLCSLQSVDATIRELFIDAKDPDHCFSQVLSLGFGGELPLELTAEGRTFVQSVAGELWNSEMFDLTIADSGDSLDRGQLLARLAFLSQTGSNCDDEVETLASSFYEFEVSELDRLDFSVLYAVLSNRALVLQNEDSLFDVVTRHISRDASYFALLEFVRFEFLSDRCMKSAIGLLSKSFESLTPGILASIANRLSLSVIIAPDRRRFALPPIDSQILSSPPQIFSVFRSKEVRLLYRGSRDGFQSGAFHRCCNGHPNTLTLISSDQHCIFGGYSPLVWNSRNTWVSDPTLSSFVFTIENPHGLGPHIFPQKEAGNAIYDHASYGPTFGVGHVIHVCDKCNSCGNSQSCLGSNYRNDTGLDGKTVFTGSPSFLVKEIEVFEVIGSQ
jgi:hypothetical protein